MDWKNYYCRKRKYNGLVNSHTVLRSTLGNHSTISQFARSEDEHKHNIIKYDFNNSQSFNSSLMINDGSFNLPRPSKLRKNNRVAKKRNERNTNNVDSYIKQMKVKQARFSWSSLTDIRDEFPLSQSLENKRDLLDETTLNLSLFDELNRYNRNNDTSYSAIPYDDNRSYTVQDRTYSIAKDVSEVHSNIFDSKSPTYVRDDSSNDIDSSRSKSFDDVTGYQNHQVVPSQEHTFQRNAYEQILQNQTVYNDEHVHSKKALDLCTFKRRRYSTPIPVSYEVPFNLNDVIAIRTEKGDIMTVLDSEKNTLTTSGPYDSLSKKKQHLHVGPSSHVHREGNNSSYSSSGSSSYITREVDSNSHSYSEASSHHDRGSDINSHSFSEGDDSLTFDKQELFKRVLNKTEPKKRLNDRSSIHMSLVDCSRKSISQNEHASNAIPDMKRHNSFDGRFLNDNRIHNSITVKLNGDKASSTVNCPKSKQSDVKSNPYSSIYGSRSHVIRSHNDVTVSSNQTPQIVGNCSPDEELDLPEDIAALSTIVEYVNSHPDEFKQLKMKNKTRTVEEGVTNNVKNNLS